MHQLNQTKGGAIGGRSNEFKPKNRGGYQNFRKKKLEAQMNDKQENKGMPMPKLEKTNWRDIGAIGGPGEGGQIPSEGKKKLRGRISKFSPFVASKVVPEAGLRGESDTTRITSPLKVRRRDVDVK
ncbi:hypothetical protein CDAR_11181 [Caerostris darwini]|uniref:Uncharacterized protein n=1 Tax=Caerostris darwini TaxID=1538125 RepID=A0AAV4V9N6_9ARAC|nr:hypothetical protein CDAR_11181 [Caerostris darwini]